MADFPRIFQLAWGGGGAVALAMIERIPPLAFLALVIMAGYGVGGVWLAGLVAVLVIGMGLSTR